MIGQNGCCKINSTSWDHLQLTGKGEKIWLFSNHKNKTKNRGICPHTSLNFYCIVQFNSQFLCVFGIFSY